MLTAEGLVTGSSGFYDEVLRFADVVLTFLAGGSLLLALGFEPPRGSGYGFYVVAGCDGQNRLAARFPRRLDR
jgi:hypothetical protein